MIAPMYYVFITYYNSVGRKDLGEVVAGPFFKYRDAEDYKNSNFSYEGQLQIMKPAYE
jgi:hypothetical protein